LPVNRWQIVGHGAAINYGSDGLRFVSPVPVGARVHARARLADAAQHPKGSLLTIETAVHIVGNEKPAMLYRAQILYMPAAK
jgi:acyl dehydratase